MRKLIELGKRPSSAKYMIAGWEQWADAGNVSSGLPKYLIEKTRARKIGEIKPDGFYLFQMPGTHHLLRPVIKLEEGYRQELEERRNEIYYSGNEEKGFLIFLGEEPHQNQERYARVFFDAVEALGVERVAVVAGVHGPAPYDKDREISCVYSLPGMKEELTRYAIKFSDYEGGATIGVYLADRAEERGMEVVVFYAMVPSYDFSKPRISAQRVSVKEDLKAWYDVMTRLNYMFDLDMDLSDLERGGEQLISAWDSKMERLQQKMPRLGVKGYMQKVNEDFTERPFLPLSDAWEEALGNLFEDSQGFG